MNTSTRNQVIAIIIVLIVIALGSYLLWPRATTPGTTATSTSPDLTDLSTTTTVTTSQGSYTVTPLPDVTIPNYKAPIAYAASISPDVQTALNAQLAQTQAIIAGDSTNFDAWVNLGVLHKIGGDYTGAEQIWQYVAAIYPTSTVAFDDLGALHMDFIKNYATAEADFLQAIKLDPQDDNAYQQLVSLYTTYGYKTKAAALALVQQGLKANPNDQTLLTLQSQLEAQ